MKNNTDFCFVILNYNTYDFTIMCIDSILKKAKGNFKIVIVDNNSIDNSGKKLKDKYISNKYVKVILNDENMGFSKGNNIGIRYALKEFNPKFIIVNNSDTQLITDNFLNKIEEIYKQKHFAVLGPKVHIKNNKLQYIPSKMPSKKQLNKSILRYYFKLFLNYTFLSFIDQKFFSNKFIDINNSNANKAYENVIIHGCFFIFSLEYFKYYDGIPEKTEFYREEEFIYLNCRRKGLLTVYDPSLEIFHSINGSVKATFKNDRKKNIFRYKMHIKALKILNENLN